MAVFAFPADGWRQAASGEWRNVTGYQKVDLKRLATLPPEAPLKMRAWTSLGVKKTTQGTLADLLAALHAGPAHLSLQLLSSSEGVRLTWGVQEPDPALHAASGAPPCPSPELGVVSEALGGVLPCPSPLPVVVSEALGGALPCPSPSPGLVSEAQGGTLPCQSPLPGVVSEALGGALPCPSPPPVIIGKGTAPGAGITGPLLEGVSLLQDVPRLEDVLVENVPQEDVPLLEDVPLEDVPQEAKGEEALTAHDTASPAALSTEALVPPGFLEGGVAPLRPKERSTGKCRPGVKGCRLKGPSPMVLRAWVMLLLLLAWHESQQDEAAAWTQAVLLVAVLCLLVALPTICRMWRHLRQEVEVREGDIDFLGRRIPFLREEEMRALDAGCFLGSGGNASARLLQWGSAHAVKKEFHHEGALHTMMREARLMLELRGAGGVPLPLALGFQPHTIIQEFVGECYDKFLLQCSVDGVLRSLGLLCRCLGEVHARGGVHNDLKVDNITVSGGVHRPVLHVIDLGWACRAGRVAGDFTLETGEGGAPREGFAAHCPWMAPEVRTRRPVFPSGDVFSLGHMLQVLAGICIQPWLAVPLWRLGQRCTREDPSCRPSLREVALAIAALRRGLLQCQLQEAFHLLVRT